MILATRHTGIVVSDMQRSLEFWRDVMGLTVAVDFWEQGEFIDTVQHLTGVNLHMIKLTASDGSMIELLHDVAHPLPSSSELSRCERATPPLDRSDLCDRGIRHIAFTVADADQSWQKLKETGCDLLSEPVWSPDKKARLFFARDPEGNLLEIVQIY